MGRFCVGTYLCGVVLTCPFLLSNLCLCPVSLPHGAMGWSAVSDGHTDLHFGTMCIFIRVVQFSKHFISSR